MELAALWLSLILSKKILKANHNFTIIPSYSSKLSLILSKKILKANHNFEQPVLLYAPVVFNIVKENSESKSQQRTNRPNR